MNDLYNAAYKTYCSTVATHPQLSDTFSWPLWAAEEYHTHFTVRVRQHDAAIRNAAYRLRFLDNVRRATNYRKSHIAQFKPATFTDVLNHSVRGYNDGSDDFIDF